MRAISQLIRSLFRLHHKYPSALDEQQAHGVIWMSWGAILILAGSAIYQFADGIPAQHSLTFANITLPVHDGVYAMAYLLSLLALGAAIIFVNRGSLPAGRDFFIIALYSFSVLFYMFTGLMSFTLFMISMPIVAAGVLLSRRGLVSVVASVFAVLVVLNLFSRIGVITFVLARPFSLNELLAASVLVLLMNAAMLIIFGGGQRLLQARNIVLTNELNSLTAISKVIGGLGTVEEILAQFVDLTRDQLGYYHAQVFLLDDKTRVITVIAGTGLLDTARRRFSPDDPGIVNEVIRSGQTRRITLTSSAALRSEFLPATRAQLLIPLRRNETVLGVLDVQSVQSDAFTAQDIDALEAIAVQIAIAIENARFSDTLRDVERARDDFQEQSRALASEKARLEQELSGRAWMNYLESRADKLVGYDMKDNVVTLNATPLPVLPDSLHPRIELRESDQVLVVPITSRGQAFGVMEFTAPRGETWDDRSIELARAISMRLALSLDNLRLFEQAQLAVAREQMANQVATILQTRGDIDSLVGVAVDAFQQALGAAKTSIRLGVLEDEPRTGAVVLPDSASAARPPALPPESGVSDVAADPVKPAQPVQTGEGAK
jgi:GAF domain-containing protein